MNELFKSIYDNYEEYKIVVSRIVGFDNIFVEDIISECVLKVNHDITNGKYPIEKISDNGKIKFGWFRRLLINRSIDRKRHQATKKCIKIVDVDINRLNVVEDCNENEDYKLVPMIRSKLNTLSVTNQSDVNVFKSLLGTNMNASKLSRIAKIDRRKIAKSNKIIKKELRVFLADIKQD